MKIFNRLLISSLLLVLVLGSGISRSDDGPSALEWNNGPRAPGPAQPEDDLSLPFGETYFSFGRRVKAALDRDYLESKLLGNARRSSGREKIIAGGGGVYVRLTPKTYNIHLGYKPTTDDGGENSGRSYGVGPLRGGRPDDLSYPDLFEDLQEYATDNNDLSDFYRAFFKVIIFCDPSGIDNLDREGQTLLSDIISIYGAELNRNIMSDLQRYDWQKHLGDVLMLAAFHARTGLAWFADEGTLRKGDLSGFIGHGTGGSGVGGKGGIERRRFQRELSDVLRIRHPKQTKAIDNLIGFRKDLFHGLMEFVNRDNVAKGNEIIEAYIDLLKVLRSDGREIAKEIMQD